MDTVQILVRIKGLEQIPAQWNHDRFLQQQFASILRKDIRKKEAHIVFADDSAEVIRQSFQFILEMNVLELRVNDPVINQQNRPVSRDVTTNTYSDETEDSRKQHTTVYADLTVYEKSISGMFRFTIATIRMPEVITSWNDIIVETYQWENSYGTYTGSFQALSSKDISLVKSKPRNMPAADQVFKDMVRAAFNKSSKKIADSLH